MYNLDKQKTAQIRNTLVATVTDTEMIKVNHKKTFLKTIKPFVYIATLLLLSDSCKKHGFGYVQGNVVDEYTNEPVPNAEVMLCREYHASDCDFLKQTTTDENGHFKMKYQNNRNSTYDLTIQSNDCFSQERFNDIVGRKSEFTIKLPMKAFTKIKVTNNKSFPVNIYAKTSEPYPSQQKSQSISANTTVTLTGILNIRVGHSTTLYVVARDLSNTLLLNVDTTILMTKKMETLLYSVTID